MRHRLRWRLGIAALGLLPGLLAAPHTVGAPQAAAGPYHFELSTEPAVVPVGRARLIVRVYDRGGRPLPGAQVRAIVQMPGMPMGEREVAARPQPAQPGVYRAPAQFAMEGAYTATIRISAPEGAATASIPLRTGQDTTPNLSAARPENRPAGSWPKHSLTDRVSTVSVLIALGGLVLLALGLWRIRRARAGQTSAAHEPAAGRCRSLIARSRPVLGGVALLVVMRAASVYAVRTLRRPGAMTPLEAQGMEMATPPPPGTAPVELAVVQRGPVEESVRYTGQAAADVEQAIYPRIPGWLVRMPFYTGDRVRRGELLARLDTSQVQPQVAERQAAQSMAEQALATAAAEYRQALQGVAETSAELAGQEEEIAAGRADHAAAEAERASAAAELDATRTQIADAQAALDAAKADREYARAQLERSRQLLQAGYVSAQQFQRDQAEAGNAEAKVRQAQARVDQVPAQVSAAQAAIHKAEAMVAAAAAKLQRAAAEQRAGRARLRSSQAAAAAARQRVAQARAGVQQAQAAAAAALATRGYAEIHSPIDGVVLARLISPGVLVSPGQAILKVGRIDPIRLQANVAEADLDRVHVGTPVRVSDRDHPRRLLAARLTSISPAVDAAARTAGVEARVPNRSGSFHPGQYLVMELSTRRAPAALWVPSRAIQWRPVLSDAAESTATRPFVWLAEPAPDQEGAFSVRTVAVRTGISSGARTQILSGVTAGQRVVTAGAADLQDGDTVAPGPAAAGGLEHE